MKLSENIRHYRKKANLSQEQLAEKLNISRQAVTKWESGTSAPSTENLLRLCEILDIPLETLLKTEEEPLPPQNKTIQAIPATDTIAAVKQYEVQKQVSRRNRFYLNLVCAIGVILLFFIIYLIDRLLHVKLSDTTLTAFLFDRLPAHNSYLIGWLHHNGLYWICMGISVIAFIFNKRFFAYTVTAGFLVGLTLGILASFFLSYRIGYNFGWIFWSLCYLFSLGMGLALQIAHSFGKIPNIQI